MDLDPETLRGLRNLAQIAKGCECECRECPLGLNEMVGMCVGEQAELLVEKLHLEG